MSYWWDKQAGLLQALGFGDYPRENASREDAYRVALHTRQDLILIVSYLSSLNKQAFHIKWLLGGILALLACVAFRVVTLIHMASF